MSNQDSHYWYHDCVLQPNSTKVVLGVDSVWYLKYSHADYFHNIDGPYHRTALDVSLPIRFCPYCGRELEDEG